jgi:hypothetical protein
MGTCMAMGQAAGTAAAMFAAGGCGDWFRDFPVPRLREALRARGAILEGAG